MCLNTLHEKKLPHKIGYKIFDINDDNDLKFPHRSIDDHKIKINRWMNAFNGRPKEYFHDHTSDGHLYLAGFHYILNKEEAIKVAKNSHGCPACVCFIKVKNVTATGQQWDVDCGVSEDIIIKEIIWRARIPFEESFGELSEIEKLVLSYHDEKIPFFSMMATSEAREKIKEKAMEFFDLLGDSNEKIIEWMSFVDILPRTSNLFRVMTSFHLSALLSKFNRYPSFYTWMVDTGPVLFMHTKYTERGYRALSKRQFEILVEKVKKQQPKKKKGKKL